MKWGIIYQFSGVLVPFVCKAAIIRIFGINYLGLNSLFTSIITTLNLAELGFGSAVVFFMYKAIADEDTEQICALQNYYKRVYHIVGIIIFSVGIALTPFLKYLIKKDVPDDINIYIIYILTLSATAVSYFMYAYKSSLLTAHQQESVLYKIRSAVMIVESILRIVSIFILRNYYIYVGLGVLAAIANNAFAACYAKRLYPNYIPKGKLPPASLQSIGKTVKGLIYYKIGVAIVTSADSIVISAFLGLVVSGKYGNYYYIVTTLFALLRIYYTSFRAGLGNSVAIDSPDTTFRMFKQLQFMQKWIISWITVCLLCMFQSFISLYAGPENMLSIGIVICICIYFYTWKIQDVVQVYKEACGYWTKDRFRPFIGAMINLFLNIITVQYIGLYGVILSTVVIAVTVDVVWAPKALFSEYFHRSRKEYYLLLIYGLLDLFIMCIPTYLITSQIHFNSMLLTLVVQAMLCVIIPNILFVIKNYKKPELSFLFDRLKKLIVRH